MYMLEYSAIATNPIMFGKVETWILLARRRCVCLAV